MQAEGRENKATEGVSVKEAGQRGGLALVQRRGHSWFAEIGSKGQKTLRARYPGMAREWGKLGGRPRKAHFVGEKVNPEKGGVGSPSVMPLLPHTGTAVELGSCSSTLINGVEEVNP